MASREQTREQRQQENRLPVAAELPPVPESAVGVSPPPTARLRVLVVDDNHANRLVASCILEERGHQVETAGDGRQAIRLAQANHYDVILMDVQMPGLDGLEATAVIRAREGGRRRVPIIAMTAYDLPEDRERCLAAGMDGFLAKPITEPALIALVEGLVTPCAG